MVILPKRSHSWWFDSHNSPRQSAWLLSTLSELDEKTKKMLKLIEEDADSFAQRAEMYYKKRPELLNLVEDFYRTHRSLAEQFDQLKLETRTRHTTPLGSPTKVWVQKLSDRMDKLSRDSSESFDSSDSEVDDPEDGGAEAEICAKEVLNKENEEDNDKQLKQREEEMERLKEENRILKAQLAEKDEQKRAVIRQLCLSVDIMKEENSALKKCIKDSKKGGFFDFKKINLGLLSGKLFGGQQSKSQTTTIVAL